MGHKNNVASGGLEQFQKLSTQKVLMCWTLLESRRYYFLMQSLCPTLRWFLYIFHPSHRSPAESKISDLFYSQISLQHLQSVGHNRTLTKTNAASCHETLKSSAMCYSCKAVNDAVYSRANHLNSVVILIGQAAFLVMSAH